VSRVRTVQRDIEIDLLALPKRYIAGYIYIIRLIMILLSVQQQQQQQKYIVVNIRKVREITPIYIETLNIRDKNPSNIYIYIIHWT